MLQELKKRMPCMEILGGNLAIDECFEAPGIDLFVHNQPFLDSETGGGDLYYLTSCASGRISRFLLADVSGHGAAAAGLATRLNQLLKKNINRISQKKFVREMNQEFGKLSSDSFATAIVATFFEPSGMLEFSLAGHPYPLYFQAEFQRWVHVSPTQTDQRLENLPLGVVEDSDYTGRQIKTSAGDMILMYSDAFIESVKKNESLLGMEGVLEILNRRVDLAPHQVIAYLRKEVNDVGEGSLADDDATLILGHFTSTPVATRDNLLAAFRLFQNPSDSTCFNCDFA